VQLRKVIKSFQDVEYNFQLLDRLFKGHGIDGEYIREVPAMKVSGMLQAGQLFIGKESVFEEGYDPYTKIAPEDLGEMAFEDAVEKAKLGTTLIDGGYLRTGLIDASRIDTGVLNAERIRIGSGSVFDDGYDPSEKETPEGAQDKADGALTAAKEYADAYGSDLGSMAYENAVEKAKLGSTILSGGYLRTGFVDASRIDTGTLNAARIGAGTISATHIQSGAITADKISGGAISAGKIAANAISTDKISAGAITLGKIAAGAVGSNQIAANAVTAGKISVGSLSAISANLGTITAGSIYGCSFYGQSLMFRNNAGTIKGFFAPGTGLSLNSQGGSLDLFASGGRLSLYAGTNNVEVESNFVTRYIYPSSANVFSIGSSSRKFYRGYFSNLPGCPTPTSNSGINVMKKINSPKVRDGKHGVRHYFLDEDFPSEMKCKMVDIDEDGKEVELEEEEIEYIRTIGVLVQSVRELIDKVEKLERTVYDDARQSGTCPESN